MSATHHGADILLRTENLTKRFPQVLANDSINLEIFKGEVHCLLGENGAGKSTLAETLYGAYVPDAGKIYFAGKSVEMNSPRDAIRIGIGMVHQHFVLVPPLSVVENVMLGTQSTGVLLDEHHARKKLGELCQEYGVELDLDAKIWHLSVGEQQWVEILKALYVGVKLLILNEPTAVLTPQATERLFGVLQKMKADGLSIIFITHKLKEVMAVSDRVTVLRKGKLISTLETSDVTQEALAEMMVGREVHFHIQKETREPDKVVLRVAELHASDTRGREALCGISFDIERGEILGLAGVSGNGQQELFDVLVGVQEATSGQVLVEGKDVTNSSPKHIMDRGMASIPEDRIHQGLVMDFRVYENLILGMHTKKPFSSGGLFLKPQAIHAFAQDSIRNFDIATPSADQVTHVLSGGNLQKLILARELSQEPKVLIANQPTRGLDVGATEYVRHRILEQRQRGAAILLISEDLDEILNLSDRIAVIFKGEIMAILNEKQAEPERIGLLMAGIREEAA